jgi:tRNA threonylcarbamoyladenosine biosynthesis protein TsaB
MKILALDSSLGGCSVALWTDDAPHLEGSALAAESEAAATGQAERLVPIVGRVAAAAGGFAAIDRFAVTVGPGYFTGLRAGLAAARGLALAAAKPLIGITTLAAVAAGIAPDERRGKTVVVALDSKRSEAFYQLFAGDDLAPLGEPETMAPAMFAARLHTERRGVPLVVAGTASGLLASHLDAAGVAWTRSRASERPDAAVVARLARSAPVPTAPPAPLYLHPPATTMPRGSAGAPASARAPTLVTQ